MNKNEPNPYTYQLPKKWESIQLTAVSNAAYYQKLTVNFGGETIVFSGSGQEVQLKTADGSEGVFFTRADHPGIDSISLKFEYEIKQGGTTQLAKVYGPFIDNVDKDGKIYSSVTFGSEDSTDNDKNDTFVTMSVVYTEENVRYYENLKITSDLPKSVDVKMSEIPKRLSGNIQFKNTAKANEVIDNLKVHIDGDDTALCYDIKIRDPKSGKYVKDTVMFEMGRLESDITKTLTVDYEIDVAHGVKKPGNASLFFNIFPDFDVIITIPKSDAFQVEEKLIVT